MIGGCKENKPNWFHRQIHTNRGGTTCINWMESSELNRKILTITISFNSTDILTYRNVRIQLNISFNISIFIVHAIRQFILL